MKVEVDVLAPIPNINKSTVSVDLKQHFNNKITGIFMQSQNVYCGSCLFNLLQADKKLNSLESSCKCKFKLYIYYISNILTETIYYISNILTETIYILYIKHLN